MVANCWLSAVVAQVAVIEPAAEPLIERLDPPRRAVVVMALMAIMLTGLLLVACVMIGARWVRRMARGEHNRTTQAGRASNRRLRDSLRPILPTVNTNDTIAARTPTDDTVTD
jgi:hypothetical protein